MKTLHARALRICRLKRWPATFAPMSRVTDDELCSLAQLARLQLSDAEKTRLQRDLEGILEHMDALAEVDTTGVVPMTHVQNQAYPLRLDTVEPSFSCEEALQASPNVHEGYFDVPAILPSSGAKS